MSGLEMLQTIRIDGEALGDVVQIQIDRLQTTVSYEKDGKQRVYTVETEAVSFA